MGAWGEGIYANDHGLDFFDDIGTPEPGKESRWIYDIIQMMNYPLYPEELRIVADQFVQHHAEMFRYHYADVDWLDRTKDELIEKLVELCDSEWVDDWSDPDLVVSLLINEVNALVELPYQNR